MIYISKIKVIKFLDFKSILNGICQNKNNLFYMIVIYCSSFLEKRCEERELVYFLEFFFIIEQLRLVGLILLCMIMSMFLYGEIFLIFLVLILLLKVMGMILILVYFSFSVFFLVLLLFLMGDLFVIIISIFLVFL